MHPPGREEVVIEGVDTQALVILLKRYEIYKDNIDAIFRNPKLLSDSSISHRNGQRIHEINIAPGDNIHTPYINEFILQLYYQH